MATGGECENCGQWFETQRYEDQGYGLCPKCDAPKKPTTQPDSILSAEELVRNIEHLFKISPHHAQARTLELIKARDEALRNAALEECLEKIQKLEALLLIVKSCCTDENLGTKKVTLNYPNNQIKLSDAIDAALKIKTPSKEEKRNDG